MVIPKLAAIYGNPREVAFLPTSGAAEAVYLALQAVTCTLPQKTTVGIPKPAYGAFEGLSKLLSCSVRHYAYRQKNEWQVTNEEVIALAQQCDTLIVNNPHNPTGRVMDKQVLQQVAEQLDKRGGVLIIDEVFLLPEDCSTSLGIAPNLLIIGSLSKVYGLAGLRFGWAVGVPSLIDKMRTLQQYTTLSINAFAAAIGSIALSRIVEFSRYGLLAKNRRLLKRWADSHEELLRTTPTEGGTTVILEILKPFVDPEALFENLLAGSVLLAPGSRCFGFDDARWFRLGYGTDTANLQKGLDKIVDVLTEV